MWCGDPLSVRCKVPASPRRIRNDPRTILRPECFGVNSGERTARSSCPNRRRGFFITCNLRKKLVGELIPFSKPRTGKVSGLIFDAGELARQNHKLATRFEAIKL